MWERCAWWWSRGIGPATVNSPRSPCRDCQVAALPGPRVFRFPEFSTPHDIMEALARSRFGHGHHCYRRYRCDGLERYFASDWGPTVRIAANGDCRGLRVPPRGFDTPVVSLARRAALPLERGLVVGVWFRKCKQDREEDEAYERYLDSAAGELEEVVEIREEEERMCSRWKAPKAVKERPWLRVEKGRPTKSRNGRHRARAEHRSDCRRGAWDGWDHEVPML
ncbi:hypothetical protein DFJ74DRAFT_237511 [Hyaloraphidium curvatum]|nr:hypothetical protein DFJ74DRAFT_237511 [Hyaloraphidium curvatum]